MKLKCLIISIFIIFCNMIIVYADYDYSITKIDSISSMVNIEVQKINAVNDDALLIVADYDIQGNLQKVEFIPLKELPVGVYNFETSINIYESAQDNGFYKTIYNKIRAFIWADTVNQIALCECVEKKFEVHYDGGGSSSNTGGAASGSNIVVP